MMKARSKKAGKGRLRGFAGLLAAMLTVSAAVCSAAAEAPVIDPTRTGSLTVCKLKDNDAQITIGDGTAQVTGQKPMKGIRFTAVKIGEIISVTDGGAVGTYFSGIDSGFAALLAGYGINISGKNIGGRACHTAEEMEDALTAMNRQGGSEPGEVQLNNWAANHPDRFDFPETDAEGRSSLEGLPLGLYLVAETDYSGYLADLADPDVTAGVGSEEAVCNPSSPFLVCLPMTNQAASEKQEEGTFWQYDVTVYPKNQTVSIPKYIVSEKDGNTLQQTEDLEIGETVRQLITPSAPAVEPTVIDAAGKKTIDRKYEEYRIRDVMQDGLRLQSSAEQIQVSLGARLANPENLSDFAEYEALQYGTDYEVVISEDRTSFEIVFQQAGLDLLNSRTVNSQVAVVFDCVLDRLASPKAGKAEAVTNQPELVWKNANTAEASIKGNQPGVYTYRLEVLKKGITDGTKASFRIERGGEGLAFVKEKEGEYHLLDNSRDTGKGERDIHPAADGTLVIRGLDADTYRFTETATQEGHELLKSSFTVMLEGSEPSNGMLAGAELETDGKKAPITIDRTDKGTAGFTVENFPSVVLRTGGPGLQMLEITGLVMLILSMVVFRWRRDR